MRRAAKVDANHAEIVALMRKLGMRVQSLAAIGGGVPDLLVYSPGRHRIFLVEIKDGSRPPSERKLTPAQQAFHAEWPVWIIGSESEAIALAGRIAAA